MRKDGTRVLIIGGGGDGIGRGISRAFAADGASVAVADLEPERARTAADEIVATGGRACAIGGDVRVTADVDAMVSGAVNAFGGLDALVTVVGGQVAYVPAVKVHEITDDDWDLVQELNVRYVARAARAAIRTFLDQGTGGMIISVDSISSAPLRHGGRHR